MKPLIIYHSETGNTVEIAEAMATAIQADLTTADKVAAVDFQDRSLIGLGSGIYNSAHVPEILRLVPSLPPESRVFIFSTSGTAGWAGASAHRLTHWWLRRALRRRKISILGEWNCPGQVKGGILGWFHLFHGRPSESDLEAAAGFAQHMISKAKEVEE
jgi:flavodoxin